MAHDTRKYNQQQLFQCQDTCTQTGGTDNKPFTDPKLSRSWEGLYFRLIFFTDQVTSDYRPHYVEYTYIERVCCYMYAAIRMRNGPAELQRENLLQPELLPRWLLLRTLMRTQNISFSL